ncbi:ABC transporter permease subunit [Nonomuraea zeae]|uniref:ABC transporter permease n=1 Tax=Nonomuraea zeae TaxID=1642303 RepID=A0A5S4H1Y8_9ACTN|nr:ABC transporter permease subunit [Nonomuraea zeae]TMR39069.1 ABC transporter permease [Nonomuraea zeae]
MTHILRSEWTKIRSVRSTVWTLAVTALLMLGLAILISVAAKSSADGPIPAAQAVALGTAGTMFAQLSIATLGVLVISSEYRTGGIRTSLMAVPKRMRLLTGKVVVFTVTSFAVSTLAAAASIAAALLVIQPAALDLADVVRTVFGTGLYLTACGLFGLALGTAVRHTPGAIVAAIALMLVLPQLASVLPGQWGKTVNDYFTTNAGMLVVNPQSDSALGPWSGFGVYLAWVAVAMLAGAVLMKRRDA